MPRPKFTAIPQFGQHLRQIREAEGVSQIELAERIGVRQNYLSKIELGQAEPSLALVYALAGALKMRPEKFLKNLQIGIDKVSE